MNLIVTIILLTTLKQCTPFLYMHGYNNYQSITTTTIFLSIDSKKIPNNQLTPADALALRKEAELLRAEAKAMELSLAAKKELRIQKEHDRIDAWINQILVNTTINESMEMLNTDTQVANLLIDMRFDQDMVNRVFDRICETTLRPQSIENCSPLISLLLDAACKVDCLERKDNPNKRWNTRVESRLRKKLFCMGYGINLEEAESYNRARAITGEKDLT